MVVRVGRYRLEHDRSGWGFNDNAIGVAGAQSPWRAWWHWRHAVREQRRASLTWHARKVRDDTGPGEKRSV